MTQSSAISAQGTDLQIETGSGTTIAVTGIVVGNPTILTAAGVKNGTVVTLSGFTGADASEINNQSFVATNATAGTFAIQVNTTGKDIEGLAASALQKAYTSVANVKNWSGFDGQAAEVDVTHLRSKAREIRLGLQDFGSISFDINPDYEDAGQNAMRASKAAASRLNYKLTYPNGKVASFGAYVRAMPESGAVDEVIGGSAELRIDGEVIVA